MLRVARKELNSLLRNLSLPRGYDLDTQGSQQLKVDDTCPKTCCKLVPTSSTRRSMRQSLAADAQGGNADIQVDAGTYTNDGGYL